MKDERRKVSRAVAMIMMLVFCVGLMSSAEGQGAMASTYDASSGRFVTQSSQFGEALDELTGRSLLQAEPDYFQVEARNGR